MGRTIRIFSIGLLFLLVFALTACNGAQGNALYFLATKVPIPFGVLVSSATPTPLPPIGLFGCVPASSCQIAVPISDFIGPNIPTDKQVFVTVQYDKAVRVSATWEAKDEETLTANLKHIRFFVSVDRVEYDVANMLGQGISVDANGNSTGNPTMEMGVVLENWKIGIPHTIIYGIKIDKKINDGWQDYEPQTIEYNLLVMPIAIPTNTPTLTLTPTSSPTPTLTFTPLPTDTPTPKPIVYTPRPTVIPPTETPACDANSSIEIDNSTGGLLTLYLNGPADYSFYLQAGTQSVTVCSGSYSYTAYGCGGASISGVINSGESHQFYCN